MSEYKPPYRLPSFPVNGEQEAHVKQQSEEQQRSIAMIIRRLIDADIKAKAAAA